MIIECNEINPYYVYRHRRLDTFEIFYVGISKVKSRCRNRSTRINKKRGFWSSSIFWLNWEAWLLPFSFKIKI